MHVDMLRTHFPSLSRSINGKKVIYLDGPAGTQVPRQVIDAISNYYSHSNANTHGFFASSQETDQVMGRSRVLSAKFLNAESPNCISFGPNMTTLNYALARALSRKLNPGDEILISQLDHEANRGPWKSLESIGITIKEIPITSSAELNYEAIDALMNERVKMVAVGMSSNFCGTANDIETIKKACDRVGAKLLLDAVHYAPHFRMDVQALQCDFLLCSAYKFYGPHIGILYSKPGLLDDLDTDRLITQEQEAPYKIETGTMNHAAFAGLNAAYDFIESLAGQLTLPSFSNAYAHLTAYEKNLAVKMYMGLLDLGLELVGPGFDDKRAPTLGFYSSKMTAAHICQQLGEEGIYAWDGHFYAHRPCELLGYLEKGGITRMGISLYITDEDVNRTLETLTQILA